MKGIIAYTAFPANGGLGISVLALAILSTRGWSKNPNRTTENSYIKIDVIRYPREV